MVFLTLHTRFVRFAIQAASPRGILCALNFMNKKDLWFLAMALGVVGLFTVLWVISRKAPPMSARPQHAGINRQTARETCWGCHTPDSKVWDRHPKKGKPPDQTTPCYVCHKLPEADAAHASNYSMKSREDEFVWLNRQER